MGEVSFIGEEVLREAVTFVGGEVITEILNDSGRGQGKSRRREGIYWEVCYSIYVGGGRIGGWVSGLFCSARPGLRKDLIWLSCLRLRM